jgi:hypothetical protein
MCDQRGQPYYHTASKEATAKYEFRCTGILRQSMSQSWKDFSALLLTKPMDAEN